MLGATLKLLQRQEGVLTCEGRSRLCWCRGALQTATQSTATEIHDRPPVLCGEEGEGRGGEGGGGGMWREREGGGRWRDVEGGERRGREEVEGCGGRGREVEGGGGSGEGGGMQREVEGCRGRKREGEGGGGRMWREVEGCGGREVSLRNSSYGLYSSTHPCTQASP